MNGLPITDLIVVAVTSITGVVLGILDRDDNDSDDDDGELIPTTT